MRIAEGIAFGYPLEFYDDEDRVICLQLSRPRLHRVHHP